MTSVLVTGGAGFIGSHLVEALVNREYSVKVLDDLSSGNAQNISHIKDRIEFIRGSITDEELLKKTIRGTQYIFHLAAIGSVQASLNYPLMSHEVNVTGSLKLIKASLQEEIKKVIYASSCAVYGDTGDTPVRETAKPTPISFYASTKLAPEFYLESFQHLYGLESICLRYFNVYGPRQNPDNEYSAVIPRFIKTMLKDEPPTIYGDGQQTRDFVFVKDIVNANLLAMESKEKFSITNIASGKSTSINQLIEILNNIMNKNFKPQCSDPRQGDILHSKANITEAKNKLGFSTKYTLEKGLEKTIEWLRR